MKQNLFYLLITTVFFAVVSVFNLMHFNDAFESLLTGIDDWNRYASHATDIIENGFFMPSTREAYILPAGFLYNYFIALCLIASGGSVGFVYFTQALLLSLTAWMIYLLFKDDIKEAYRPLMLLALLLVAYIDIFRNYTFVLLSENIAMPLLAAFLLFLKNGTEKRNNFLLALTGIALGLSCLTRPNIFPFALVFYSGWAFIAFRHTMGFSGILLSVISFLLIAAFLPFRNYVITGDFILLPNVFKNIKDLGGLSSEAINTAPGSFLTYYFKKLVFIFGYTPALDQAYTPRPHWFIIWGGFIYYVFMEVKNRSLKLWEFTGILLIIIFYGVLLAIAPIHVYGFRFIIPVLLILTGFSLKSFFKILP